MATTSKCDTLSEYIERNKVYELIGQTGVARIHVSDIDVIPVADVAPVHHGKWLPTTKWWQGGSAWKQCSECGILHLGKSNFCPNCGAKMDI